MRFTVFFIFSLLPQTLGIELLFNFAVWNVGQGSWATFISSTHCIHIDMGGERFPEKTVELCKQRKNTILVTHEDWDHINFINRFRAQVIQSCLFSPRPFTKKFLTEIPLCQNLPSSAQVVARGSINGSRNSKSAVYLIGNKILISGDSPIKQEHLWLHRLKKPIPIFILGHHGSKTSTSLRLLDKIRPRQAISSARKKKYGHPHNDVVKKLKQRRVPLLRTEIWGTLYFSI